MCQARQADRKASRKARQAGRQDDKQAIRQAGKVFKAGRAEQADRQDRLS